MGPPTIEPEPEMKQVLLRFNACFRPVFPSISNTLRLLLGLRPAKYIVGRLWRARHAISAKSPDGEGLIEGGCPNKIDGEVQYARVPRLTYMQ